jgi:acyl-coenzyme A thioesterase PaaI-like protein
MNDKEVRAILPKKRKNLNHIQSMHACAIATIGEFCAGMSLLQSFPSSEFRIILSNLKVEYLYQGRTDLTGSIQAHPGFIAAAKDEIQADGKTTIELETLVTDTSNNVVAKVQTTWQIKRWDQVKTVI